MLRYLIYETDSIHSSLQTFLDTFLSSSIIFAAPPVLSRYLGKIIQDGLSMDQDDGMPVGHVKDVALPLDDGSEECCAEVIGVKELREFCSPVAQILGYALGFLCASTDGSRLD